jgi:hypothetical protein
MITVINRLIFMKNVKRYFQSTVMIGLLSGFTLLSSCTEDETVKTELLSFGPAGVLHGEDIRFIGTGLDKITSIVFPVDVEVAKAEFKSQTSTEIVVTVPFETMEGKVILKAPSGDIETKTNFALTYTIEIEGKPDKVKPGTNATFTGQFLNYVKEVTFFDGLAVTEFVSQSRTELVVTVPMAAKTGPVIFSDAKEFAQEVEEVVNITLPEVTSLSPTAVKHAQNLTITGTDLDLVTKVTFPSGASVSAPNFVSQSTTSIVVTVPTTSTGGKLILTVASDEEVQTSQSISIILPVATAFTPSDPQLHVAGANLTITGTDLDLVGKLKFPGVSTPVTTFTKTATQIDVVIPTGVQGGTLILETIHGFAVPVTLPFGDQLVLVKVIYDDAVQTPFGAGGGWGGVATDAANTEQPRVGTKSIKVTFANSWGGGSQFGTWCCSPLSTAGTTYFAFSVYGGAGTEGKEINVNVSGVQTIVSIKEGQWKDVKILLTSVGNPASLSEIWFQDRGFAGVIYIDHIGLK